MSTEKQPTTLKEISFTELIALRNHFDHLANTTTDRDVYVKEVDYLNRGILARFQKIKGDSNKKA